LLFFEEAKDKEENSTLFLNAGKRISKCSLFFLNLLAFSRALLLPYGILN